MPIKKFWTIKDGIVGTAHINRRGDLVDFRKAAMHFWGVEYPNVWFQSNDGDDLDIVLKMRNVVISPDLSRGHAFVESFCVQIDDIVSNIIYLGDRRVVEVPYDELGIAQQTAIEIKKNIFRNLEGASDYCARQRRNKVVDFWENKNELSRLQKGWLKKFFRTGGEKCFHEVAGMIPPELKQLHSGDYDGYGHYRGTVVKIAKEVWGGE